MGKIERDLVIKWDAKENLQSAAIRRAKEILLAGGVVAFPTESFYGLAVNISDERAIKRLFHIKQRPNDQPILILIPSFQTLQDYVDIIPPFAQTFIQRFWPGGLTLVFHAGNAVSPLLTAGTGKIGVRLSSHPIATALAREIAGPITGTSANLSGKPPCSSAEDVSMQLGDRIDLILDGGRTSSDKGSTILDITVHPPVILREGMIEREQLASYLANC
ncbi:MAG: threonylcarbamoyl-AMP synthase [Deltaproteobacteria bacterium]|nr:threonylcarbamoyl-AMP synthase [Deltaproteobacteria bacterium]